MGEAYQVGLLDAVAQLVDREGGGREGPVVSQRGRIERRGPTSRVDGQCIICQRDDGGDVYSLQDPTHHETRKYSSSTSQVHPEVL